VASIPSSDPAVDAALRATVERSRERLDALADRLSGHLIGSVADLADEPEIADVLVTAAREGTAAWLAIVRDGALPREVAVPESARALSRAWVRRNRPLPPLLRAYRLAHGFVAREMLALLRELADDPGTLGRASERLVELSFGYVDGLSAAITDLFLGERQRLVRSAELARAEVVTALLAGEAVDVDAAERRLGHPLRGHHLGLVLWAEGGEATDEPLGRLESEAQRLADAAGGRALLRIPVGGRLLWAWIAGDAPLEDRALRAAPSAAQRTRPTGERPAPREAAAGPLPAALHVAIGAPAAGPAGFVRSHEDALETRRVAVLAPRPPRLSRYRDTDRLGALAEDEDGARRLRVTLRAHLEERGSNVAVARRLGIHENTVKYRVRKARELLAAGAADDDPLALGAALRLADLLPAP
jgi:predicted DNA-binding protein (UPF0251 family)